MSTMELTLNPTRAIYNFFGSVMKSPDILKAPEIILGDRDFVQSFHKIVYAALNNIIFSNRDNISDISPIDVDNYLAKYPNYYRVWEENNGVEYLNNAKQVSNTQIANKDYETIKKFSLLRNYVENGIDVSDIYEYDSNDLGALTESNKVLENTSINEIIEHFTQKAIEIRNEWNVDDGKVKDFKAGDDLDGLLDRLVENPDLGFPFQNLMYNTLFRGMRKEKFMLRSGATGTGKTRQAIRDMVSIACEKIWVTGLGWKSLGPSFPALFISTEIEQEELQTIMLAYLTGIPDSDIKNGNYDAATRKRLEEAIEILKKAPLFMTYIEDFSISDIEMKIEEYIVKENVQYVAFDYVQMTPKLSKTMSDNFGTTLREDQILVHFSSALKGIAGRYGIFLESSTQLNRGSKEIENRDASSLRGGLATADKVDYGVLTFKVSQKEKDGLKHILQQGFGGDVQKTPDFSHWVYKNRAGLDHVVIWTKMNLGTMREEVLFVTDYDFNLIEINGTEIEFESVDTMPEEIENVPVF